MSKKIETSGNFLFRDFWISIGKPKLDYDRNLIAIRTDNGLKDTF